MAATQEPETPLKSVQPGPSAVRRGRRRLTWRAELVLAGLPTAVVLIVLAFVEVLADQRLLFASLAGSAFLIYLDPEHGTNRVKALVTAQLAAAAIGFAVASATGWITGASPPYDEGTIAYVSGGLAMVLAITLMILLDVVHPPAVPTALAFAFRGDEISNVALFGVAVAMTAVLVLLQRWAVWVLPRLAHGTQKADETPSGRG